MGYVLETGALWKGPLGHSKVIFDFGDIPMYTLEEVYPNNFYIIKGNQLIWERSDFKPSHNLWVTRNSYRYSDDYINMYRDKSPDQLKPFKEKIEFFNLPAETIKKTSEQYYQLYQALVNEDLIRALYIKSALGLPNGNRKPDIVNVLFVNKLRTLGISMFQVLILTEIWYHVMLSLTVLIHTSITTVHGEVNSFIITLRKNNLLGKVIL